MSDCEGHNRQALVGDIGRTAIRLGLTDEAGSLLRDSIRIYDSFSGSSVASVIGTFIADSALERAPSRSALAISGVPRGDIIPVTNSRLMLSRPEISAMLGTSPLILNDFAANAWALSSQACAKRIEPLVGPASKPYRTGSYCIIGVGSGLGVALLSRDEFGVVSVIPSEAGHMGYMSGLPEAAALLEIMFRRGAVSAEAMLSRRGLVNIYQALAQIHGADVTCVPNLLDVAGTKKDPLAEATRAFFAKALWHFAGNMALAYGAWDGVVFTGSIPAALRSVLRRAQYADRFAIDGPYADRLREVPRFQVSFEYAELEGAAVALLTNDARRAHADGASRGKGTAPSRPRSVSKKAPAKAGLPKVVSPAGFEPATY